MCFGVGFDATLLARFDVDEWMRSRRKMMGILAKHFRIPPEYWADKPLSEMFAWFADMIALSKEEAAAVRRDGGIPVSLDDR
jgi:hypothetical protein